ncbi:MAG: hypothetical protein HC899_24750 [Leptolyngbyaceae cyanobacterium SM1_4_3]|nr:hypothetical protein [Leptolyngbyaceae cyanobacterium SM1_4_3]NJN91206.1 hypothetical protein [Leptolyngbyaceae cyanobacterium SL_5_14]
MPAVSSLLPAALAELTADVAESGNITLADRYGLMAAILDESISDEERFAIDRLLRAVYRGQFRLVDELSVVM